MCVVLTPANMDSKIRALHFSKQIYINGAMWVKWFPSSVCMCVYFFSKKVLAAIECMALSSAQFSSFSSRNFVFFFIFSHCVCLSHFGCILSLRTTILCHFLERIKTIHSNTHKRNGKVIKNNLSFWFALAFFFNLILLRFSDAHDAVQSGVRAQ